MEKGTKTTFGELPSGAEFEFATGVLKDKFRDVRFNRLTDTKAGAFVDGKVVLLLVAPSLKVLKF